MRYWMHARFLLFDGEKMSKSKGNLYTIEELVEKGFKKNAIRYALISSHYRQNYNFTFDGLKAAEQAIDKIEQCVFLLREAVEVKDGTIRGEISDGIAKCIGDFDSALSDDLNISKALACCFDFIREINKIGDINAVEAQTVIEAIGKIDSVLGVLELDTEEIPEEIKALAEERKQAKAAKDYTRADEIRQMIAEKNYVVEDVADGEYRIKAKGKS